MRFYNLSRKVEVPPPLFKKSDAKIKKSWEIDCLIVLTKPHTYLVILEVLNTEHYHQPHRREY